METKNKVLAHLASFPSTSAGTFCVKGAKKLVLRSIAAIVGTDRVEAKKGYREVTYTFSNSAGERLVFMLHEGSDNLSIIDRLCK